MNEKAEYPRLFLIKCPKEEVHRYYENYKLSSSTLTKIVMNKQLNTYKYRPCKQNIPTSNCDHKDICSVRISMWAWNASFSSVAFKTISTA